jgi:uncharacterized protein YkwD
MLIKRNALVAFAAVFLLFAATSSISAAPTASLSQTELTLLNVVNQTRATHGLQPVRFDMTLERAARAHSGDMLRKGYFAHGPFVQRLRSYGAKTRFVGENLAWGSGRYARARWIVESWLASPSHRANLLRPGFDRIGIGALRGSFQGQPWTLVVTADFGGR